MNFETEKICLNQIINQKRDSFDVEENIIIPDVKPDILSSIDSCGNIYVYKREVVNGKLKIDGGIYIYTMYLADNEQNNIRSLHTVIDFSKNIDLDSNDTDVDVNCGLSIRNIECKILNGRKINIKATIDANMKMYSNTEKEFVRSISDEECVQMISDSAQINLLKGKGETVATAKDVITIDDNLADILSSDISVRNKDIKISYNKVLSKADVVIEILYLTEEEKINTVTAQIPIMGFIDIPNVSDKDMCDTNYEVRNIDIKPNNVEDHSINVEIEFAIGCSAFENRSINLIQDLYSPRQEIKMNQETVKLIQDKSIITDMCNIQEKINISEIKGNRIFNIKVSSNIIKENILNNAVSYEGEITLKVLYESSVTNRMEVKKQKIPFTHNITSDAINKNSTIDTCIEISSKDFICMPDNTINVKIDMCFVLSVYTKNNINIVNNITVENNQEEKNNNSMVIYFVKDGDTLWKIAKKFKSTIDEIAKVNSIENIDKINVGKQLYIPKYVYNRI